MSDLERIEALELENARLRADRDMLLKIISQMRKTLDRMVGRFVVENNQ